MRSLFKRRKDPIFFVLLSLLLHAFIWTGLLLTNYQPHIPPQEIVEVNFEAPPDLETEVKPVNKTKDQVKALPRQIVEQNEKRINDEKPKDTRFLSKFDQTLQKQTRAKEIGAFTNTAENAQSQQGTLDGEKKKSLAKVRDEKHGELPKLTDLVPQFSATPHSQQENAQNPGRPSQTDDYLRDVDAGMQTLLSTKEFVFYSYYQRIKDQLRQHWEPAVRERVKIMYRKGRTLASSHDRVTQVLITLDPRGFLERIDILGQSGVPDIDDAAVEAFRKSAPFPNPPKGIVDPDGHIRIRWDFILEA